MASTDAKQPLLSSPQTKITKSFQTRRLRHCKSAPLANAVPILVDTGPVEKTPSIFLDIHPSFKTVAIFLAAYIGIGTICFYIVSNQMEGKKTNGILDAVYFCVVTMTTVGYGDLVPDTVLTKLLACGFVFSGMAMVALILSKSADYLLEKQEALLVKALHVNESAGPSEINKEIEINRVLYKCITVFIVLLVLMISGTVFLGKAENLSVVNAFYCVCATITTLGYGDESFSTTGGRLFAVVWIPTSTICLAQFFLYVAEMNTEKRQKALVDWVLHRRTTNLDLEAADLDGDGVVGSAEFIIYKLKEMGKISQEDIFLVLKEFEELDVDQSGSLSQSDITLAQL